MMALILLLALFALLSGCGGSGTASKHRAPGSTSAGQGKPATKTTSHKSTGAKTAQQKTVAKKAEKTSAEVKRMSIREAVGQMFVIGLSGTRPDYYIEKMIRQRNIGGVMLFGYNMKSEQQTKGLTAALQRLSLETEPSIPLFVATDQEGGEVSDAPWVKPEPAAEVVGRSGNPEEARRISREMGRELLAAGINTDFAPVVDTGFGAAIGSRSYGSDPALVARMGAASISGFKEAGIVSTAKHFPNHGAATSDSHTSRAVVDHSPSEIRSYDLPPFEAAIKAGVPMVMVGHLIYPAIDPERPASLSPKAIGMLRRQLGFQGVIVTDDLNMTGATGEGTPAQAAVKAAKAGADLLLVTGTPQEQADAYNAVLTAVESGEIPESQVRSSVKRILKVKEEYLHYNKQQ